MEVVSKSESYFFITESIILTCFLVLFTTSTGVWLKDVVNKKTKYVKNFNNLLT